MGDRINSPQADRGSQISMTIGVSRPSLVTMVLLVIVVLAILLFALPVIRSNSNPGSTNEPSQSAPANNDATAGEL